MQLFWHIVGFLCGWLAFGFLLLYLYVRIGSSKWHMTKSFRLFRIGNFADACFDFVDVRTSGLGFVLIVCTGAPFVIIPALTEIAIRGFQSLRSKTAPVS